MNCKTTRRSFLAASGVALAAAGAGNAFALQADVSFQLAKLPYAFDALEPHIDAKTVEIHWDKHHRAYVTNVNKLLEGKKDLLDLGQALLTSLDKIPAAIRQGVINNLGGHFNHTLYWEIMSGKGGGDPSGALGKAIDESFGSFDKFKGVINQGGMTRFGSGWTWLVVDKTGKLKTLSTPNQDSPLMQNETPVLGIDVWEHAYYLKYQNRRADYLAAWWNLVNWKAVADRYGAALKK
ncbi:MAG: superoxide dismutase [Gemmataceae bacterium]|nr:superoxide dismutase [Gemmataceae bacterium]